MIELPQATVIARQITEELRGKEIIEALRGQSPHKFMFKGKYSDAEFAQIVRGKTIGKAQPHGMAILTDLEPAFILSLGCGGERILYHTSQKTVPKKHQLKLDFQDGTYLTVTVSGWGEVRLVEQSALAKHPHIKLGAISPLSDAFTFEYFNRLFDTLPPDKRTQKTSAKYFIISEPAIYGVGNGCLQDILYQARIHPKRQMLDLSQEERRALYDSIRRTLDEMVERGGRNSEYDLYNKPGGYQQILHSKAVGQLCPECEGTIQKAAYLGGSIYFCSSCQLECGKSGL